MHGEVPSDGLYQSSFSDTMGFAGGDGDPEAPGGESTCNQGHALAGKMA